MASQDLLEMLASREIWELLAKQANQDHKEKQAAWEPWAKTDVQDHQEHQD